MLGKTKLSFYRLLSAILLVVMLSMSSVMYVSAHGGDVTLIHACVNNRTGAVRIVSPTTTCDASKETALDWGIQGPKGDKGDTGPKGSTGVLGIYSVMQSSDANVVSEFTVVQASCVPGDKVTGVNSGYQVIPSFLFRCLPVLSWSPGIYRSIRSPRPSIINGFGSKAGTISAFPSPTLWAGSSRSLCFSSCLRCIFAGAKTPTRRFQQCRENTGCRRSCSMVSPR